MKKIMKVKNKNVLIKVANPVPFKSSKDLIVKPTKTAYSYCEVVAVGDKVEDTDIIPGVEALVFEQALSYPIDVEFEGKDKDSQYYVVFDENLECIVSASV